MSFYKLNLNFSKENSNNYILVVYTYVYTICVYIIVNAQYTIHFNTPPLCFILYVQCACFRFLFHAERLIFHSTASIIAYKYIWYYVRL